MKSLKQLIDDYIMAVNRNFQVERRIEIVEFKLGIHNPNNPVIDIDMLDNPTYRTVSGDKQNDICNSN